MMKTKSVRKGCVGLVFTVLVTLSGGFSAAARPPDYTPPPQESSQSADQSSEMPGIVDLDPNQEVNGNDGTVDSEETVSESEEPPTKAPKAGVLEENKRPRAPR